MRQIVLDTETTGIKVEEGHRIIEIGCIEMINRKLTGKQFHYYLNPEREIEAGAQAVHGLTNGFLQDKPLFSHITHEFITFVKDAELIIHNAAFDISFLNYELELTKQSLKTMTDYCQVTDTLHMARLLHPGQRNNLDALCKRYHVDNSKRDLHGALLDAHLLAQVYLAMTGGQGSFFDALNEPESKTKRSGKQSHTLIENVNVFIQNATNDELAEHENYLKLLQKSGKCLWLKEFE